MRAGRIVIMVAVYRAGIKMTGYLIVYSECCGVF